MVLGSFSHHLLRVLGLSLGKNRWQKSLEGPRCFVIFRNNNTQPYSSLPSEAVFANSTGMLVVVFGLLVLYILLVSSWKRPEPGILSEGQVRGLGSFIPGWDRARPREGSPRKGSGLAGKPAQ